MRRKEGQKVVRFFCYSRVHFLSYSLFLLGIFSQSRDGKNKGEGGREGIGGVTTDVLPPSESCLFDGDSGAYHVA